MIQETAAPAWNVLAFTGRASEMVRQRAWRGGVVVPVLFLHEGQVGAGPGTLFVGEGPTPERAIYSAIFSALQSLYQQEDPQDEKGETPEVLWEALSAQRAALRGLHRALRKTQGK